MKIAPIILFMFFGISLYAQETKTDSIKSLAMNLPDSRPEFPGGVKAFMKHITVRMRGYKPKVNGTAIIYFIVETDGTISGARAVKGIDNETDARLVSIISNSVNWKPAIQGGKPIRASLSVPVKINL